MFGGSIKKAIQDLIIPEFQFIKGELKRLDEKMDLMEKRLDEKMGLMEKRLDEKIDSVRNEMNSVEKRLEEKITSGLARMDDKIVVIDRKVDALDRKIDLAINIHERLASLEAKVAMGAGR
ncbi:MAG: hypothetical protein V2A53_04020 [bacterium]